MKQLPESDSSLVIRTDFSDDKVWSDVRDRLAAPVGDFRAYVNFVEDQDYDSLTIADLLELVPAGTGKSFVFLADRETITNPEHPALVVDLLHKRGRTFRVIPSEMWSVENNLSLCNMDWEDFADNLDSNGVHRGFDPPQ
jgi:hypothetical protein